MVQAGVERFDLQAVVVTSFSDVFAEPRIPGIPYVVPDILDPLNRERYILGKNNISIDDYIGYMASKADTVFLSGQVPGKVRKLFKNKIRPAYPAWEGPAYEFVDEELDYSPNYIGTEPMLRNATALLEV